MTNALHAAPDAIAVVGMSGRFPGAATVEEFWDNLQRGIESITVFTEEELAAAGTPPEVSRAEGYVRAAGVLDGIELFDARCFGFSPRDAELLDPQQRLFLECAWEALERAACNPDEFRGLIGVYAGTSLSLYAQHHLYPITGIAGGLDDFQVFLSNDKDHVATRTAYKLNLRGPAVTVQTACSTSLVAICTACDSLLAMQCDLALAGGVTIRVPQTQGYVFKEGGIGSPDGHCRSFDAAAKGTVGSSGVAVVALKRLPDALEAGDHIHALVRGWALNNDGSAKVGYTAPSVEGQAEVVEAALTMARLEPEDISYIEAHGTATPIGDPIEVAALSKVYGRRSLPRRSCALGSVKSNVGHLDSAAGAAGFIKTVLALEHRLIPASLHFTAPNPQIDFDSGPFYVNDRAREWTSRVPRRAGVSSFGIGGTNAHVILEEPPPAAPSAPARAAAAFVLSAHTATALNTLADRLAADLERMPGANISDVAATLQLGRKALSHRRAFVARHVEEAVRCLRRRDPSRVRDAEVESTARPVTFMFPGQGAQHAGMAASLYRTNAAFAADIDRAASELAGTLPFDLRETILGGGGPDAETRLQSTAIAQPALFAVEYALAKMWMRWGVAPSALIGHSLGEYVAAAIAGVFTFEDALRLVATRGELMAAMPPGAMAAVSASPGELEPLLQQHLSIAAINGSRLTVVSGPFAAIDALERDLAVRGVATRRLHTSHAFHSAMMDPVLAGVADAVARARPRPPRIPIVSNLTGTWLTDAQATDPQYWARHAREPVRFAAGLRTVRGGGPRTLFETGPGRTLTALARMSAEKTDVETVLASLPLGEGAAALDEHLADTLAALWLDGCRIDWAATHEGTRRQRVALSTYPFERQRYWIVRRATPQPADTAAMARQDLEGWFSLPSWMRKAPAAGAAPASLRASTWLILSDRLGVGTLVADRLRQAGADVTLIAETDEGPTALRADGTRVHEADYYRELLAAVDPTGEHPPRLVHCWSLTPSDVDVTPERALLGGMYSLMALVQAVIAGYPGRPARIDVIADILHGVIGTETTVPLKRAILAVAKGVTQEYPNISCRVIELGAMVDGSIDLHARRALAELQEPETVRHVAYRSTHRWVPTFDRIVLPGSAEHRVRSGGVYLITGGLGQIGLALASHLTASYGANVTLMGRTPVPDRQEWNRIAADGNGDATAARIRALLAMEASGGGVLVIQGDAAVEADVRRAWDATRERFGPVDGVIHAAGLTTADGFAPLAQVDVALCERHLAAKVASAMLLAEFVREQPVDFVVLMSSLSSVLVGLGFVPYAAANMVLDALAERESARGPARWISIGWDGWDFTSGAGADTDLVINPAEGILAFERILAGPPEPHIVVSTTNLEARIRQWITLVQPGSSSDGTEAEAGGRHARPDLSSDFVAPATDVERAIAAIWQSLLGLEQVGLHDNFFELGGHSLLAIQLTAKIREQFRVDVPVRTLFDAPTIAALAAFVDTGQARVDAETTRIVRVLEEVERLSDDEMQALLAAQWQPIQVRDESR